MYRIRININIIKKITYFVDYKKLLQVITMNKNEDVLLEIAKVYNLDTNVLKSLIDSMELKQLKKGEVFSAANEFQDQFFFLISGIARAFMIDKNDKQFTRSLFTPLTAMASVKAISTNTKAEISYDCLTDCNIYVGSFTDFQEEASKNVAFSNIYGRMLEKAYLDLEQRVYELSLPAKERYELLRKQIPRIDNLIPQYQIATYLGITPVQLSRIRSKK